MKKVFLCLAVFLPPTFVALSYPHIFLTALSYAGGFSCAILFGIFPPVMVWVGRYIKKFHHNPQIPGGKGFLATLIIFVLIELGIEISQEIAKF
jgi:tyrosine-specific transport protein